MAGRAPYYGYRLTPRTLTAAHTNCATERADKHRLQVLRSPCDVSSLPVDGLLPHSLPAAFRYCAFAGVSALMVGWTEPPGNGRRYGQALCHATTPVHTYGLPFCAIITPFRRFTRTRRLPNTGGCAYDIALYTLCTPVPTPHPAMPTTFPPAGLPQPPTTTQPPVTHTPTPTQRPAPACRRAVGNTTCMQLCLPALVGATQGVPSTPGGFTHRLPVMPQPSHRCQQVGGFSTASRTQHRAGFPCHTAIPDVPRHHAAALPAGHCNTAMPRLPWWTVGRCCHYARNARLPGGHHRLRHAASTPPWRTPVLVCVVPPTPLPLWNGGGGLQKYLQTWEGVLPSYLHYCLPWHGG